jgi:hypothetical protein
VKYKKITVLYSVKDKRKESEKPFADRILGKVFKSNKIVKSKEFKSQAEATKFKKKLGSSYVMTGYNK